MKNDYLDQLPSYLDHFNYQSTNQIVESKKSNIQTVMEQLTFSSLPKRWKSFVLETYFREIAIKTIQKIAA